MTHFNEYFLLFMSAAIVNNYVLTRFLGLCIFFGVSKSFNASLSMGMAIVSVMSSSSMITWAINRFILVPFNVDFLRTIVFVIVIASFVQLMEIIVKRFLPGLYKIWGIYLLLVATNCIVLGVPLINAQENYNFISSLINSFGSGVGFSIALLLMAGIREKLEYADIPNSLRGLGVAFISAGFLALAFQGFNGMLPK
ncbi:MAG TPA: electron transport complex subunit RsxA [Fibrobacteres bacterium]|nr:electron transport complex subunit RsxA [Fibrobacterota bacterium]